MYSDGFDTFFWYVSLKYTWFITGALLITFLFIKRKTIVISFEDIQPFPVIRNACDTLIPAVIEVQHFSAKCYFSSIVQKLKGSAFVLMNKTVVKSYISYALSSDHLVPQHYY